MAKRYRDDVPKRERVILDHRYWKFVQWCAIPTPLRDPRTAKELAEKIKAHNVTFTIWKKVEGFYDDVRIEIKKWGKESVPDVIASLKNKILRDGTAAEAKLFLQWADDWSEESRVRHSGKLDADLSDETKQGIEEIKTMISEFDSKLREKYAHKIIKSN